jgi:hypothetical protein
VKIFSIAGRFGAQVLILFASTVLGGTGLLAGALSFEAFDYPAGSLGKASGGKGWAGDWVVTEGGVSIAHDVFKFSALTRGGVKISPGHLRLTGSEPITLARQLRSAPDMMKPGEHFLSFLYRLGGSPGRLIIILGQNERTGGGNQVRLERRSTKGPFTLSARFEGEWNGVGTSSWDRSGDFEGESGLVVVRISVADDLAVRADYWQFSPGEKPEAGRSPLASMAGGTMTDVSLDWLVVKLTENTDDSVVDIDEIRVGTTWESVTGK